VTSWSRQPSPRGAAPHASPRARRIDDQRIIAIERSTQFGAQPLDLSGRIFEAVLDDPSLARAS
jgi:hypothetical protein